jgi:hypothetical protein
MTEDDATAVFTRFGASVFGLAPTQLKDVYIGLARKYHPDGGFSPDERVMAAINAAYEVLRRRGRGPGRPGPVPGSIDPKHRGVAVWAWAGHDPAGTPPSDEIRRHDDRDRNYVKRRLWKLSSGSREEWTIWPFDGRRFMPPLTVYGTSELFAEMAKAALTFAREGFRGPRAVFVQRRGERWPRLLLVSLEGEPQPGIPFEHQGDLNPTRDAFFVQSLPTLLDRMRGATH